jgi:hypothetical protein
MNIDNNDDVNIHLKNLEEADIELGGKSKKQLDEIIDKNKQLQLQPDLDLKSGVVYRIVDGECKGQLAIYYRDVVLVFQIFPSN